MWQLHCGHVSLQAVTFGHVLVDSHDNKADWSARQKFMGVPLHDGSPSHGPVPPEPVPPEAPAPPVPPVALPPAPPPPLPAPPAPPSS